jgi:N-acetylglucosamine kinase
MILCFDIGGTAIKPAEAHGPDDIRIKPRIPTPTHDFAAFIAALQQAVAESSAPPVGLSFSIAGVVDRETGLATVANIPCLTGRALQADLEQALGLPVVLANDADCFALAEALIGAGKGHDVVFGLILGTGVGGGVVVRGALINQGGFAGEIGHGPVAQRLFDDPAVSLPAFACGCGLSGCLDAICSARGVERLHDHLHGVVSDSRAIVADWAAGDPAATRTIEVWLAILSGPLALMQNVLGAGVIVVGGGLATAPGLIAALDQAVRARCLEWRKTPLLIPAACKGEPGLLGAALLGLQRMGNASETDRL